MRVGRTMASAWFAVSFTPSVTFGDSSPVKGELYRWARLGSRALRMA